MDGSPPPVSKRKISWNTFPSQHITLPTSLDVLLFFTGQQTFLSTTCFQYHCNCLRVTVQKSPRQMSGTNHTPFILLEYCTSDSSASLSPLYFLLRRSDSRFFTSRTVTRGRSFGSKPAIYAKVTSNNICPSRWYLADLCSGFLVHITHTFTDSCVKMFHPSLLPTTSARFPFLTSDTNSGSHSLTVISLRVVVCVADILRRHVVVIISTAASEAVRGRIVVVRVVLSWLVVTSVSSVRHTCQYIEGLGVLLVVDGVRWFGWGLVPTHGSWFWRCGQVAVAALEDVQRSLTGKICGEHSVQVGLRIRAVSSGRPR